MKARSLWSSFAQPAIERKTSQPRKSQSRSTLWRSMFGLESAGWGPRRFASSMEYWKLASTATSWRALWFLSCERSYRTTDLCKTTIPSILRGQQSNLWRTTESTGGARLPRARNLNPIENLWHEVKFYQETRVKPRTKEQLVDGIKKFWAERMSIDKCNRYIDHVLEKAILKCVEEKGAATGY